MVECLGTHLKKASILRWKNISKILQQLEGRACNIESLEIDAMYNYNTYIYYMYSYPIYDLDRATVSDGIGLFGETLEELFITGPCNQYTSLNILLGLLPALTHLTIKLTYSSDEADSPRTFHVEQIVKHCPRLNYLLALRYVLQKHDESSPVDFASMLETCPSIHYVNWGGYTGTKKVEKEWLTLSRREREYADRENTSDYEKRGANYLRHVEFRSDIEEQHISTLKVCLKQRRLLENLRLSGFSNIGLCRVWNSVTHYNSNLLTQWPQLKLLEFDGFHVPHQIANNMFFENLFSHFQRIEQLKVRLSVGHIDNVDEKQNSIYQMYKAIGHQLHQLRYLYIDLSYYNYYADTVVLCRHIFTTLCNWNQKLEMLRLSNVAISNDMLLDLCHHPKLHTLQLEVSRSDEQLNKDGWISFGRKLKEQEQRGYCGGKIQTLCLLWGYSDGVTDEVLEEFAGIKSLKTLTIGDNNTITDTGINKFLNTNTSSGKSDKKIQLYGCSNVSSDNPHIVSHVPILI